MSEKNDRVEQAPGDASRREFVKSSAKVAATAPAVALLLSASVKPAGAITQYQAAVSHILDDFTYGNNRDDFQGPLDQ